MVHHSVAFHWAGAVCGTHQRGLPNVRASSCPTTNQTPIRTPYMSTAFGIRYPWHRSVMPCRQGRDNSNWHLGMYNGVLRARWLSVLDDCHDTSNHANYACNVNELRPRALGCSGHGYRRSSLLGGKCLPQVSNVAAGEYPAIRRSRLAALKVPGGCLGGGPAARTCQFEQSTAL